MTEQLKEAIERLKKHNEWRRGADIDMCEPKQLGKDIETLITAATKSCVYQCEKDEGEYEKKCVEIIEEHETLRREIALKDAAINKYYSELEEIRIEAARYRDALIKISHPNDATPWYYKSTAQEALKTNDGQGGGL